MHGMISASAQAKVNEATMLRFRNYANFRTPESLILYEQGLMSREAIFNYCQKKYSETLELPRRLYVNRDVDLEFDKTSYIPMYVDNLQREIHVANIPEFMNLSLPEPRNKYKIVVHPVDIVWYVQNYMNVYGYPDFLYELPAQDLMDFITEEAIDLKVMDTTISSGVDSEAQVYHNVNLRTITSKRRITNMSVLDLTRIFCYRAGDALDPTSRSSKRISVSINKHYRGRVEITPTYHGYMITMRLLPNTYFSYNLEDIHLEQKVITFIRRFCKNIREPGARILAGPTGSGKNTTIFSVVKEIQSMRPLKLVSLEQPVELLLKGMEQIEAPSDSLFQEYARSLIRHNPDCIYFSEITDRTAHEFMKIANTGKTVFSTVHTNSAATIVSRLVDLTGLTVDRVIQDIHSLIYQNLVESREHGVRPINTCIYFSNALRRKCIGKNLGEIMSILYMEEDKWRTVSASGIEEGMLEM